MSGYHLQDSVNNEEPMDVDIPIPDNAIFANNQLKVTNKHFFAFCSHANSVTENAELYPIRIEQGIKQINYYIQHGKTVFLNNFTKEPITVIKPQIINDKKIFRVPALIFSMNSNDKNNPDYFLNMGIWYLHKHESTQEYYTSKRILDFEGMLGLLGNQTSNITDVLLEYAEPYIIDILNNRMDIETEDADIGLGFFCCRNIDYNLTKPFNPNKRPVVLFDSKRKPYIFDLQNLSKKTQYNHYAYPLVLEAPDIQTILEINKTTFYPIAKNRRYASALNVLCYYGIIDVAYATAAVTCLRNETSIFKIIEYLRYYEMTVVNLKWSIFNIFCIIRYSQIALLRYFEMVVPLLKHLQYDKNKFIIMTVYKSEDSAKENRGYTFSIFFSANHGTIHIIDPVNTTMNNIPTYMIYDCKNDKNIEKILIEIKKFLETIGFNSTDNFLFDTLHIFTTEKERDFFGYKINKNQDMKNYILNMGGVPVEYPHNLNYGGDPDQSLCPLEITDIKVESDFENKEPTIEPTILALWNGVNVVEKQSIGGKNKRRTRRNTSIRKSKRKPKSNINGKTHKKIPRKLII
jgi:hypothetical protein